MRVFVMVTLAIAATAPIASANPYELSLGGSTRALRSTSADAVTPDSLDGGVVAIARALPIDLAPHLQLAVESSFRWGSARGELFQTIGTTLDQLGLELGGRARYALLDHLAATAHAAFGSARTALELDAGSTTASGSGWSAMVEAGGGIELTANPKTFLECGVRVELSYIETRPAAITIASDGGDSSLAIAKMSSSFGHLDASGPQASVVMWTRF